MVSVLCFIETSFVVTSFDAPCLRRALSLNVLLMESWFKISIYKFGTLNQSMECFLFLAQAHEDLNFHLGH